MKIDGGDERPEPIIPIQKTPPAEGVGNPPQPIPRNSPVSAEEAELAAIARKEIEAMLSDPTVRPVAPTDEGLSPERRLARAIGRQLYETWREKVERGNVDA